MSKPAPLPVLDMALVPQSDEPVAVAPRQASGDPMADLIERAIHDPTVDVDKMDRLMQMHERVTAKRAEEQFNAAMAAAQSEMRTIGADKYNSQTKSKYVSYEALDRKYRPVYTKHGFGISFDTGDAPGAEMVRVLAYVTHAGGHSRTYKIDMPSDGKGAKGGDVMTKTHATGAASSYGCRYLFKMIWNVSVGDEDVDGNDVSDAPREPEGYADWFQALADKAQEGLPALQAMWRVALADETLKGYVCYMQETNLKAWETMKATAAKVKGVTR